jgi:UDP-2,3-diacylglucosamine hydrolase
VETIGIIAGKGNLPLHIATEAAERGYSAVSICFPGFTDPAIEPLVRAAFWLKLGQLQKGIEIFKSHNISHVVMAGKIEKLNMLRPWNLRPDLRCLGVIKTLKDWRDDTILAALACEFQKDGLIIDEITEWASKLMARGGVMTKKAPNEKQWADIEFGRRMAQGIGALDMGQTVVVKNSAVIAAEAIEGTDRTILRAGDLNVPATVVVKMAKPQQDMRFDVPGVGPTTIESMIEAKAKVLAVEMRRTMIADGPEMLKMANKAGIVVAGIPPEGPVR